MPRMDIAKIDRRIKLGLLAASVATLLALGAAALRENVFAPWRQVRNQYAGILQARATDARGRDLAEQFEVRVVQNVLPELGTIDRCITCHPGIDDPRMANEPQPFRTHPGDYLVNHPPEKFGCTICHRGQGRALVFDESKAVGHHWDYPLLPENLTASACGVCHGADEVAANGGAAYALGKTLFEQKGCFSCHKVGGRGGSLGPALDNEGLKVPGQLVTTHLEGPRTLPQWLLEHFEDPQKLVAGSQMRPPRLSEEELEALTVYMLSLQQRDLKGQYLSPAKHLELYKKAHPDPMTGEALYGRFCANCHQTGAFGAYDKFFAKFMPAVRGPYYVQAASPEFLDATIRAGHPGTLMPAWSKQAGGLSDEEIAKIRDYLLSGPVDPQDRLPAEALAMARDQSFKAQGNATAGQFIFDLHCAACHAAGGAGDLAPSLANPVFQEAATDGFLFATIAYGRRDAAMPGFLAPNGGGFGPREIENLVTYLRSLRPGTPAAPNVTDLAARTPSQNESEQVQ